MKEVLRLNLKVERTINDKPVNKEDLKNYTINNETIITILKNVEKRINKNFSTCEGSIYESYI